MDRKNAGQRGGGKAVMNGKLRIAMLAGCAALMLAACGEQSKIDAVKKTVIPNCEGKTMEALAAGLLQNPVWGYEKAANGRKFVTVNGTVAGDSLPAWVKSQKILDATFRFALDPATDAFDPKSLDGLPSLTAPEGIFQVYKAMTCS
jgi:hypothetical protein